MTAVYRYKRGIGLKMYTFVLITVFSVFMKCFATFLEKNFMVLILVYRTQSELTWNITILSFFWLLIFTVMFVCIIGLDIFLNKLSSIPVRTIQATFNALMQSVDSETI